MKEQKGDIICWWSGGITSAVACKLAIDLYGPDRCRVIMIDTHNEDDDTYRFKLDCEKWFEQGIEAISVIPEKYSCIQDVWRKYLSLNVAHGAICSSELKRELRKKFEASNTFTHQVFGFDIDEPKRAKAMTLNYPGAKAIYLLLMHGLSKKMCIEIVQEAGIEIPNSYKLGYSNNNCRKAGCVQGGFGYWQKIGREEPEVYRKMAMMEHELTDAKGEPVTCCRDQSKRAKETGLFHVFLLPHPDYPLHRSLADMGGREPEPLFECNGFGCAVNDLMPNPE